MAAVAAINQDYAGHVDEEWHDVAGLKIDNFLRQYLESQSTFTDAHRLAWFTTTDRYTIYQF